MDKHEIFNFQYRQAALPMGVYQIKNNTNGKVYIGSSANIAGIINRHKTELNLGKHRNEALQRDWRRFGEDSFSFETVERLEMKADDTPKFLGDKLVKMEEKWLNTLNPYDERGYNYKKWSN